MVEVFKTNVEDCDHAIWIIDRIHKTFTNYTANFDLEDCDNILRIKCVDASIESQFIINLVQKLGFYAEILQDKIIPVERMEYM
jgi:hypothetical protein